MNCLYMKNLAIAKLFLPPSISISFMHLLFPILGNIPVLATFLHFLPLSNFQLSNHLPLYFFYTFYFSLLLFSSLVVSLLVFSLISPFLSLLILFSILSIYFLIISYYSTYLIITPYFFLVTSFSSCFLQFLISL